MTAVTPEGRKRETQNREQEHTPKMPPAKAPAWYGEGLVAAGLVLVWTAALGYGWLAARMLEIDEYLSFYTDSQPTVAKVLKVQLHYPISLDPPTYHLLSHMMMQLLGPVPTALRLPALFGFLVFQATLFLFVRRIAGWRAGIVTMLFPVITASFFYAVQGRPYGLLLGAYGLAMLCWQGSVRGRPGRRAGWLVGLAAALVVGITSHFFGLLILVPIAAGELARTLERRRIDPAIAACLAVGAASIATVVPFQRAAAEYRVHYYNTHVPWNIIPQSYAALFVAHHRLPLPQQHIYLATLCVSLVLVAVAFCVHWRSRASVNYEFVAIATMAALPVFGYLLGVAVTHTADTRYVIATLFALLAALGIVLEPALRRNVVFAGAVAVLGITGFRSARTITSYSRFAYAVAPARFQASPEVTSALASDVSRPIYVQSLGDFFENTYYAPPALRRRFSLVYAQQPELRWLGHDTNYITAKNMAHFAPLSTTSYETMLAQGGHPLVLNYYDSWNWLSLDLAARGIVSRSIGKTMGGELVELELGPGTGGQGTGTVHGGANEKR